MQSERSTIRRLPKRASYDRATIDAILDEALICHVGFVVDGAPVVIPTIHWRHQDLLYLHGSAASRMLRVLREGAEACVTATLLDGLVLARSAFHHSMNYRSVVLFGQPYEVTDREEKLRALDGLVEHVMPGRSRDARPANERELRATLVLAMQIGEASAKIRTGGPVDDDEDLGMPIWAGVLPLKVVPGMPLSDAGVSAEIPDYIASYRRGT